MRKIRSIIIVSVSFLVLTLIFSVGAQISFFDDFSGNLLGWTEVSGTWAIEGGELSGETTGSAEGWFFANTDPMFRRITVEFDMTFLATPGGGVGKHGGMMIATSMNQRYGTSGYSVDWIDRDNAYRIARWDNGAGVLLDLLSGYTVNEGQQYHWNITFDDSVITLSIDGAFIGSVTDTTYTTGLYFGVWLYSNNQHAHFDNVDVQDPEPLPDLNVVPEYPLGTVLAVIAMLTALGVYKSKRIRIHH